MKQLYPHQQDALDRLRNGCILVGGTGSGKTLVGLAYYYTKILGGSMDPPRVPTSKCDLYVITTARKRDDLDWSREAAYFGISPDANVGLPSGSFVVDSWNNIKKYTLVRDAFFIFDEQRSSGYGSWSKAMIKIARKNRWIMLSATPADRWLDLVPIFIANGFYRSKNHFASDHIVYSPYTKYPKVLKYTNTHILEKFRDRVYVPMPFTRNTTQHILDVPVKHRQGEIDNVVKTEWNIFTGRPIMSLAEHNFVIRRIVNQDPSRIEATKEIHKTTRRLIIFYNFNFELDLLRSAFPKDIVFEYNSQRHDPVPESDVWVYLVQYMSGNEAWECFSTNHMLFYSLNYSYRMTVQAMGRINRLNTKFTDLYYYRLLSGSSVDNAILNAFVKKKNFNDKGLIFK